MRLMREPDPKPILFISIWELHPETRRAHSLLQAGEYSLALREVADRFIERCRELAKQADELEVARLNGGPMIRRMFEVKGQGGVPLFAFNEFESRNEQTEHRGLWQLSAGLVDALRNPRSHGHESGFPPVEAFEWLCFLSTMHRLLDRVSYLGRDEAD